MAASPGRRRSSPGRRTLSPARGRRSSPARRRAAPPRETCSICVQEVLRSQLFRRTSCSHEPYCRRCFERYASIEVRRRPVDRVPCMHPCCGQALTRAELRLLLGTEFYALVLNSGRDLGDWARRRGVRMCPGCAAAIERNGGCEHMFCIRCGTHFTWDAAVRFLPIVSVPIQARLAAFIFPLWWLAITLCGILGWMTSIVALLHGLALHDP
mmetsp:Transcript_23910/g.72517  ORF Transcript_23910/g.72517 Transcript_23910/m.72517 type:complete len:212 (+) Transcript_23910:22-657(+)